MHYPKEIDIKVQYFFITDTSLFVNCKCKKETAKSAICNSSSSIITGNVIRFDNNFLFFGNFFVKLKDQNTSKFFANHLRRGGRFCEISSKVAKYKRIPGFLEKILNTILYLPYFLLIQFLKNSNVVKMVFKFSYHLQKYLV